MPIFLNGLTCKEPVLNPFVNPPFLTCPKCGEKFFGVIVINEFGYYRRCAKCSHPRSSDNSTFSPLPKVSKTVIYLDQFMLSNMVKSLHPNWNKSIDGFYLEAFKRLNRLSKLQLIVCPDSQYHESESIFSRFPAEHKRVYELLSHGITYEDSWMILRREMHEQLSNWLNGKEMGETKLEVQRVVSGKINTWQDRILITVDSKRMEQAKPGIAKAKAETFQTLQGLFGKWEKNPGQKYPYWFKDEISQWPSLVIDSYKDHQREMDTEMFSQNPDPFAFLPNGFSSMFQETSETLRKHFPSQEDYELKLSAFMVPKTFEAVPFVRIFSMVMATLGGRISSGGMRKENLLPSMLDDAFMVSTVLPFCDAIFLEKQMAGFLRENPLKSAIKKMPKVFSLSNKDAFLTYLSDLESNAPAGHLKAVEEVYGKDWPTPFTSVLSEYKES